MFIGKCFQIITDLSGIAGSMWNLTNFFKIVKYILWFQIFKYTHP